MANHKKNRGTIVVGAYDLRAKYTHADSVRCDLHELFSNGDCDVAVTQSGYGATEAEALSDAVTALRAALHASMTGPQ